MAVPSDRTRRWPAYLCLALVAVGFAVLQVVLVPLDTLQSWDESIYAGQFVQDQPQTVPSAHRAFGMALLLAPVTAVTSSFTVVRAYLTVVITLALFFAYRTWIPVDARVPALAALLFAVSSEPPVLAHLAMPNMPAALASVAVLGFFVRAAQPGRSRSLLVGLALSLGALALIRPPDAVFVAAPLTVAMLLFRRWRRLDLLVSVATGMAIGGLTWLVEAFVRFGGPVERLAKISHLQSTTSGDPVGLRYVTDLMDRVAEAPGTAAVVGVVGLFAVLLALLGIRGLCGGWPRPAWLLTLAATVSFVGFYYGLLTYTSERYMMPSKAMFSLVVAAALVRVATAWSGWVRKSLATALVVAIVLTYAQDELHAARASATNLTENRKWRESHVERIRAHGIRPPCRISGYQAPAYAYELGCHSGDNLTALPSTNNWHREFVRDRRLARQHGHRFVAVRISEEPPENVADWERIKLGKTKPIYAYFAPWND